MSEGVSVTLASLSSIATALGTAGTWFWGIFSDLINTIASNDLLLWSVILAIVTGTVGLALTVIRKFGIKGRR